MSGSPYSQIVGVAIEVLRHIEADYPHFPIKDGDNERWAKAWCLLAGEVYPKLTSVLSDTVTHGGPHAQYAKVEADCHDPATCEECKRIKRESHDILYGEGTNEYLGKIYRDILKEGGDGGYLVPDGVAKQLLRLARGPWYRRLWRRLFTSRDLSMREFTRT